MLNEKNVSFSDHLSPHHRLRGCYARPIHCTFAHLNLDSNFKNDVYQQLSLATAL